MKKRYVLAVFVMSFIFISGAADKTNSLLGTWVVTESGLVLTFSGKDSLSVTSVTDSSVKGNGTYLKNDSTFSAIVKNNDIIMKMNYRYRWKNQDNVEAQAILFTVNEDTVDSPKEWTAMTRNTKGQKADQETQKKAAPAKTAK